MSPHELAARLIGLRQHSLQDTPEARSIRRAYRDDITTWAAWLQTQPASLEGLLSLLVSEIALERQEQGLPAPDVVPAPPTTAPDPDVELVGYWATEPHVTALVDRLAVQLAALPDWRIELELDDGSTITARPARQGAS